VAEQHERRDRVPLSIAGMRLGVSYWVVRDRVLRGTLDGGRDEFGRWFAYQDAVERALAGTMVGPTAQV
jgi:hypothetical protein